MMRLDAFTGKRCGMVVVLWLLAGIGAEASGPPGPGVFADQRGDKIADQTAEIELLDRKVLDAGTALIQGRADVHNQRTAPPETQALAQLVSIAKARRQALEDLLQKNPQLAATRMLPAAVRKTLPPSVQEYVEEEITFEGKTSLIHADDFKTGRAINTLFVNSSEGESLEVLGLTDPEKFQFVGKSVSVKGYRMGRRIAVPNALAV